MVHSAVHEDGRHLYSNRQLLEILKMLPDKKKVEILSKALEFMNNNLITKYYAIAKSLGCNYDEVSMHWASRKDLNPKTAN